MAILVAKAQGGGGSPTDAQYVVMVADATLTQERVLTAGSGVTITDGGAGNPVTVAANADILGASYVAMALTGTLTSERVLTGGTGIIITDGGAGGAATVAIDAPPGVLVGQANTWTTGTQTINTGAAGTIGVVVKGAAGQTANLQEWQDSAAGILMAVTANGELFTDRFLQQDTNTLVGVATAGDGNMSHAAGDEGYYNTLVGYRAGRRLTTGYRNVLLGYNAGHDLTTGNSNVAIGPDAGADLTTGRANVLIGRGTGNKITSGSWNTLVGMNCGRGLTTANFSTFYGYDAGRDVTSGASNCLFGNRAGYEITTGVNNCAFGRNALLETLAGRDNVGMSYGAGLENPAGSYNIFIGNYSGRYNQTGSNNVLIGHEAGAGGALHNKSGCVMIGYQAGENETGSNKLYLANSNTVTPLVYGEFDGGGGVGIVIHSPATGAVVFTAKGIAGEAANLQNWETSAGVALMEVEAGGVIDYRWAMGNSTKNPSAVAPDDWVEIKIGGNTYYLPAYLV